MYNLFGLNLQGDNCDEVESVLMCVCLIIKENRVGFLWFEVWGVDQGGCFV